jgi:polyferredoxin
MPQVERPNSSKKGLAMATRRKRVRTLSMVLDSERHRELERLKPGILLLLGAWVAYFFVVHVLIKPFDRIVLPELDLPLSTLLVAPGLIVLFAGALYLAARTICKPDR